MVHNDGHDIAVHIVWAIHGESFQVDFVMV